MRVTRRIVLTLLTKALYEFGCFKEKVWSFLKFWIWQRCYFTELPWHDFAWFCMILQHFEFVNWRIRFLMSRTGYMLLKNWTTVLRISHSLRIKRVHEFTPVWRKCAQIWLLKLWAANSLSTFKSKFILWLDLLRGQLDQKMGFSWNRKWQLEI